MRATKKHRSHKSGADEPRRSALSHAYCYPALAPGRQRFGVRWQSAATTPLLEALVPSDSGVALRFPPPSKATRILRRNIRIAHDPLVARFPLTLALSLGEREGLPAPLVGNSTPCAVPAFGVSRSGALELPGALMGEVSRVRRLLSPRVRVGVTGKGADYDQAFSRNQLRASI